MRSPGGPSRKPTREARPAREKWWNTVVMGRADISSAGRKPIDSAIGFHHLVSTPSAMPYPRCHCASYSRPSGSLLAEGPVARGESGRAVGQLFAPG